MPAVFDKSELSSVKEMIGNDDIFDLLNNKSLSTDFLKKLHMNLVLWNGLGSSDQYKYCIAWVYWFH